MCPREKETNAPICCFRLAEADVDEWGPLKEYDERVHSHRLRDDEHQRCKDDLPVPLPPLSGGRVLVQPNTK